MLQIMSFITGLNRSPEVTILLDVCFPPSRIYKAFTEPMYELLFVQFLVLKLLYHKYEQLVWASQGGYMFHIECQGTYKTHSTTDPFSTMGRRRKAMSWTFYKITAKGIWVFISALLVHDIQSNLRFLKWNSTLKVSPLWWLVNWVFIVWEGSACEWRLIKACSVRLYKSNKDLRANPISTQLQSEP